MKKVLTGIIICLLLANAVLIGIIINHNQSVETSNRVTSLQQTKSNELSSINNDDKVSTSTEDHNLNNAFSNKVKALYSQLGRHSDVKGPLWDSNDITLKRILCANLDELSSYWTKNQESNIVDLLLVNNYAPILKNTDTSKLSDEQIKVILNEMDGHGEEPTDAIPNYKDFVNFISNLSQDDVNQLTFGDFILWEYSKLDSPVNESVKNSDDLLNKNSVSKYDEIADRIAKQMVKKFLKDPDSAKFKEVTEIAHDDYLRYIYKVTVNAKNDYGGYVGYESYWVYFRIIPSDDINDIGYVSLYNLELIGGPPKWDSLMGNGESYRPDEWNKKPESDSDY